MDSFCANQVEAVGREADHVQITALSRALKVALDVAYLSPAAAPPSTPQVEQPGALAVPGTEQKTRARADPNRVDIVKFIVENGMMLDIGTMLFRPGVSTATAWSCFEKWSALLTCFAFAWDFVSFHSTTTSSSNRRLQQALKFRFRASAKMYARLRKSVRLDAQKKYFLPYKNNNNYCPSFIASPLCLPAIHPFASPSF